MSHKQYLVKLLLIASACSQYACVSHYCYVVAARAYSQSTIPVSEEWALCWSLGGGTLRNVSQYVTCQAGHCATAVDITQR